jgi:competence protein ComEC
LWWLCNVAHWAAALPGASVPVPAGAIGAFTVAAVTVAAVALVRWRKARLSGRHETIGW